MATAESMQSDQDGIIMLVEINSERGTPGYIVTPVSKKWRAKFAQYMLKVVGKSTYTVYFQGEYDLPDEIKSHRDYRELSKGWSLTIRVDPWIYGYWLGYDAYTVAEK